MKFSPTDYLEILKALYKLSAVELRIAAGESGITAGSAYHERYWQAEYLLAHKDFFVWLCHQHPLRYGRLMAAGAKLAGVSP